MGGKSRKTGGISKALIDRVKSQKIANGDSKPTPTNSKKTAPKTSDGLLEE